MSSAADRLHSAAQILCGAANTVCCAATLTAFSSFLENVLKISMCFQLL